MNFDRVLNRRGSHCAKWDLMENLYNVPTDEGLAMWVADMDFQPPQIVQDKLQEILNHGFYGYFGDDRDYLAAIVWWMKTRHNWDIDPSWIFTTHGLVNGTALCVETYTKPGDGVILMTPVYHAFARVIRASDRDLVECELVNVNGRYEIDIELWSSQLVGHEKMFILCSPHNPGGRVWTRDELQMIAEFCKYHDLVLVSDEIHHDLVFPDFQHIPMALVDASLADRLIMMTSATKTFNIAGAHSGNVIIEDSGLRQKFSTRMVGLGLSPNSFGLFAATAAYSPEGALWVDDLLRYLDANRKLFDDALNSIPGVTSMELESTYLSWVNFEATGMDMSEIVLRVEQDAKIAANYGHTFGKGGQNFLRFNIAMPRSQVEEAARRLVRAFSDLQ
ncbi:MAG: pyridoxal phosphate-dependent aminotransferase [Aestuariivita sp.]|nr:pyridoxal phosphate-dependent aminotransferase [Aestuariivita sp.]